jgi:S-adenosylmethionine-diacylglycerol 3-amino-3-carboxypropyl transferase
VFDAIYSRSLVYNTCWEDPAVDRQALQLGPDDTVLVITSAGCNALDYALCAPRRVHAVDANPRQTALLELKLAGIRRLDHEDFFRLFGQGRHPRFDAMYRDALRADLSPFAQDFWDRNGNWFSHAEARGSFYYHGLSGIVARGVRGYLKLRPKLDRAIRDLTEAPGVDEQRHIYDSRIKPLLWTGPMNWMLGRQLTLSMLGVPHPQRKEVQAQHAGGVAGYVQAAIEYVVRHLPVADNYFWRVYLRGHYTPNCCPEYLKRAGFERLKGGLADRVVPHTSTVTEFLHSTPDRISKFVLLDHMDWMSSYYPAALAEEWEAIFERATPGARAIFRSAHSKPRYLDSVSIVARGGRQPVKDLLHFHDDWARALTRHDRVHTYAGFHIADLAA